MNFGVTCFAEIAFSDIDGSEIVYANKTNYASTHGYNSHPEDLPANTHFDARLSVPLRFTRSIVGQAGFGGRVSLGYGDIELNNDDGFYDSLGVDGFLDGRRVKVKLGAMEYAYSRFGTIFEGFMQGVEMTESTLVIKVRDATLRLERTMQQAFYGGTGGDDGTTELKGKPKPLTFGQALNVSPVIVDPANLLYQVHAGEIEAIDAVYDRGLALTPVTDYTVDLAAGTFTLLNDPDGQITADVRGHKNSDGDYLTVTADIVEEILRAFVGMDATELDAISFSACATAAPAPVGLFIGSDSINTVDAIGALMTGIGGFYGFRRNGQFQVGVFTEPATASLVASFTRDDVLDIERVTPPSGINPPNWRRKVGYQKNWTVQTSDIAGAVTTDRRAFLAEEYRIGEYQDETITTRHPLATDPDLVQALFSDKEDADAEAERLVNLYGAQRSMYRVELKTKPFLLDIGQGISLTYPRWDLRDGKQFRIVSIDDDAVSNRCTMQVFG